jgi:uncharacterized membrane protein
MGWLTAHRHAVDRPRVRAAVEAAERGTSAEIVVSVSPFFVGNVWRAARRAFEKLGIARTRERNGVLLFVVPARREVGVMADDAIHARLGAPVWREIAEDVAAAFGRGEGTDGVVDAVARLGASLASAFPRRPDDINELDDCIAHVTHTQRRR